MATCACGQSTKADATKCERCTALNTLELGSNATTDQISDSYRTLVKVWHPDRFQADENMKEKAGKKLADINAAYQYLLKSPPPSNNAKSGTRQQAQTPSAQANNYARYSQSSQGRASSVVATRSNAAGKFIFVVAIALLVIAFVMAISHTSSSVSNPSTRADEANSNTRTDTSPTTMADDTSYRKPSFSVTSGNTVYHGAISSNVGVAVMSVNVQPYLVGFGDLIRPDGKFVLVTLAISNGQHDAITMSDGLFEIVDLAGNIYSASEKSMEVGNDNNLFLAQINPGITKVGEAVFDVPRNLSLTDLQLRFHGGMTGSVAEVALRADTTVVPPLGQTQESEQNDSSQQAAASSSAAANYVSSVANQVGTQEPSPDPLQASNAKSNADTADAVHHPGGSGSYPKLIHSVTPEYSEVARQSKISGTVRLYLLVDKNGNPSHVQVVKGLGMGLDENAVSAVEQYRFEPAKQNGIPVTVDLYTDVKFQIF